MELVRWDQVEGVNRIQSRINELFEDTFGRTRAQQSAATGAWYPPVDILESKDSYLIRAELPGMRIEDLKTEVNEGILTLSGERKFDEPANGVEYHRVERVAGAAHLDRAGELAVDAGVARAAGQREDAIHQPADDAGVLEELPGRLLLGRFLGEGHGGEGNHGQGGQGQGLDA